MIVLITFCLLFPLNESLSNEKMVIQQETARKKKMVRLIICFQFTVCQNLHKLFRGSFRMTIDKGLLLSLTDGATVQI